MAEKYDFVQTFDPLRKLQYVNSDPSVMHCHHYAALYTKLALDFQDMQGPQLLRDSLEESYYIVLKKAVLIQKLTSREAKQFLVEEHFRLAGLGTLRISLKRDGGTAKMDHSHMDEGWIKKWGKNESAVNFIGQGYLAAAFAVMWGLPLRSFEVVETQSIVSGSSYSAFTIQRRKGVV